MNNFGEFSNVSNVSAENDHEDEDLKEGNERNDWDEPPRKRLRLMKKNENNDNKHHYHKVNILPNYIGEPDANINNFCVNYVKFDELIKKQRKLIFEYDKNDSKNIKNYSTSMIELGDINDIKEYNNNWNKWECNRESTFLDFFNYLYHKKNIILSFYQIYIIGTRQNGTIRPNRELFAPKRPLGQNRKVQATSPASLVTTEEKRQKSRYFYVHRSFPFKWPDSYPKLMLINKNNIYDLTNCHLKNNNKSNNILLLIKYYDIMKQRLHLVCGLMVNRIYNTNLDIIKFISQKLIYESLILKEFDYLNKIELSAFTGVNGSSDRLCNIFCLYEEEKNNVISNIIETNEDRSKKIFEGGFLNGDILVFGLNYQNEWVNNYLVMNKYVRDSREYLEKNGEKIIQTEPIDKQIMTISRSRSALSG